MLIYRRFPAFHDFSYGFHPLTPGIRPVLERAKSKVGPIIVCGVLGLGMVDLQLVRGIKGQFKLGTIWWSYCRYNLKVVLHKIKVLVTLNAAS